MTDPQQFEVFMRNHQDMVFATAVRLLGNRADAEDIAQAVFLKACERFAEIGSSPTAGGWLRTVATNLCLNHLARYRRRWRFFSEMWDAGDENAGDFRADADPAAAANTLIAMVLGLMALARSHASRETLQQVAGSAAAALFVRRG